jgi:hypothetical protein
MTARRWIIIVLGAAAIGAVGLMAYIYFGLRCCAPPPPVPQPAPVNQAGPAPATGIRARPEREQLAAAFAAAFGANGARSVGDNEYRYEPGGLTWIGERAVLVSPGTNSQDCHACAGTLAVHYLAPEGDGFRVTGAWLEGGGFDDYGRPPEWGFSSELTGQPMLRTASGGGNQGIFCNQVAFTEFSEGGPRQAVEVPVGYSNASGLGGPDDGAQIEGRIRNVRPNQSFEVAYSGTRAFVERWLFRDGRWAPERPTQVPTC